MSEQDALSLKAGQTVCNINRETVIVVSVDFAAPGLVLVKVNDRYAVDTWVIPHTGIHFQHEPEKAT